MGNTSGGHAGKRGGQQPSREPALAGALARWFAPVVFGGTVAAVVAALACAPQHPGALQAAPEPIPEVTPRVVQEVTQGVIQGESAGRLVPDRVAFIAIDSKSVSATLSATGPFSIEEQGGAVGLVKGQGGEPWRIEQRGQLLRVAGSGNDATPWRQGPFVVRPAAGESVLRYDNRRYRGELIFTPTDTGILVVNRLLVEDYLRGVVPIEIGTRQPGDLEAIEAQVIAARSYSYMRIPSRTSSQPARGWNMTNGVQFQVYAGMDVEHPLINQAIDATSGLVLRYNGLVVDAPYFSSCGGRTAGPGEVWNGAKSQPWLQPVDDIDPRTGRPYCDLSPKNHWKVELDEPRLKEVVRRALQTAGARNPRSAVVRRLEVGGKTASGRASAIVLATDRGNVTISARDIRTALADQRGAILPSTYFSVEHESQAGGKLTVVTLSGAGNGHGVGMCQWGAIGRARAGIDARSILQHYYPGTVVGFAE